MTTTSSKIRIRACDTEHFGWIGVYSCVNYPSAEDRGALAMNLNHNQSSVRCLNDTSDNSSYNVERFRAFGAITCPRGVQDLPKHHRSIANITTRNSVRISAMSTAKAPKFKTVSVPLIYMSATRATSTGVLGIHQLEVDALSGGFVFDKELSLSVRPTIDPTAQVLPLADTGGANIRQFFHNDSSGSDAFSPRYKPFGGTMQQVFSHGSLIAAQSSEKTMGGTGAYRLHLGSGLSDVLTAGVQLPTMEEKSLGVFTTGCGEQTLNSRINPDNTTFGFDVGNLNFVSQNQVPISVATLESRSLPSSMIRNRRMFESNGFAPKSNSLFSHCKVSFPNHWVGRAFELNFSPKPFGFIGSMGSGNSTKSTQSELGRKSKVSPNDFVILSRQGAVVKFLGFKNDWTNPIASRKKLGAVFCHSNCWVADLDFGCTDCFQQLLFREKSLKTLQENTIVYKLSNHNKIGDGNSSARLKT